MNAIILFQGAQLGNNIHPFVSFEVSEFAQRYEQVYLICLDYSCSDAELRNFKNVHIVRIKLSKVKRSIFSLFDIVSNYGLADCVHGIRKRVPLKQYIKKTCEVLMIGRSLYYEACKIIRKNPQEKWVAEGYWLSGPAYAVALIKRKYPGVICISRAHSSEIDVVRNPAAVCQMKKFIYRYLDRIFFVSEWGKRNFTAIMSEYGIKTGEKCIVSRLGVVKKNEDINPGSSDCIFRILTCSRAVKLKRLDLLAKALEEISDTKIEWTHIGDGPDLEIIKEQAKKLPANIVVRFLGSMSNEKVHDYLGSSPIDLFVNVSQYEGLPVSVMEAFAYGIPALATSAGGTAELVNDNTGKLIPVETGSSDLADYIRDMIDKIKRDPAAYKKNAFSTWNTQYNQSSNYSQFFEEVDKIPVYQNG